jgi:DNA-binding MarR family transcriptional regulator
MEEKFSTKKLIHSTRMKTLVKRLYYLRGRFKAILPENLVALKQRMERDRLEGKDEGIETLNMYFYVGFVLNRQSEPMTMGDLSRALEVPFSTATHQIDWFVHNNYARRLPDPDDRRIVRVELTEEGKQILDAVNEFMFERMQKILDAFSEEEQQDIMRLLEKFIRIVEEGE